jgi:hypothetical protein
MRTALICLLAAVLTFPVFAQQAPAAKSADQAVDKTKTAAKPPLPADAPSKDQLIRLFDVMEVQKQVASMMTAMGSYMEKMMPSSMGTLSEKQKTDMAKLQSDLLTKTMSPEFVDAYFKELIPVYQRHFTKSEVDELISFYASPVGQKFLREQPALTQESLTTIVPLTQKRIQEVMDELKFEQRIKEIFAEDPPAKQP